MGRHIMCVARLWRVLANNNNYDKINIGRTVLWSIADERGGGRREWEDNAKKDRPTLLANIII